jgi:polyhydroxyalkanoate synthase
MNATPQSAQVDRLRLEVERAMQRNIKGWQYLTSPGKAGGVSKRTLLEKRGTMNFYHYEALSSEVYRTPILFVMATSNPAYVFDLLPDQSMFEFLLKRGHDIYLLDWTAPALGERTLRLEDYVLGFIADCIRTVRTETGEDQVSLVGYCMGGVLSVIYTALHSPGPVRNLACFTTPFNFSRFGAWNLWSDPRYFDVDKMADTLGFFPPEMFVGSVDMLRPVSRVTATVQLWDNLWNDEYVKTKRALDKWSADTLPLAGEYFRQTMRDIVIENRLYDGALQIGGRRVDVGQITAPFLHAVAEHDHIVPYAVARELVEKVGSTDKEEIVLKGGHVSIVAGPSASKRMWPKLDQWLAPRSV